MSTKFVIPGARPIARQRMLACVRGGASCNGRNSNGYAKLNKVPAFAGMTGLRS